MTKSKARLGAFVAGVGIAASVAIGVLWVTRQDDAPPPAPPLSTQMTDPQPWLPCDSFWAPWRRLVEPDQPRAYLERLRWLIEQHAARSAEYRSFIAKPHDVTSGGSEHVCIAGSFDGAGAYTLTASGPAGCRANPGSFLDHHLDIDVERLASGNFRNTIHVAVGTGAASAGRLLRFEGETLALLRAGYRGWSQAFPAYFALNRGGLATTAGGDGQHLLTLGWQTQPLLAWAPQWATYLMRLSDIVAIHTAIGAGAERRLATTDLNTIGGSLDLAMLSDEHGIIFHGPDRLPRPGRLDLDRPSHTPLEVVHDIKVRFRGLVITLKGMRFAGDLDLTPERIAYDGRFRGVDAIAVEGNYRGMSLGSMGKMIHDLVKETLQTEIGRMVAGNGGKGWTFHIGLDAAAGGHALTYATAFESPVNFLNLLREDKNPENNPVLPDQRALADFNAWGRRSVDALLGDLGACAKGR